MRDRVSKFAFWDQALEKFVRFICDDIKNDYERKIREQGLMEWFNTIGIWKFAYAVVNVLDEAKNVSLEINETYLELTVARLLDKSFENFKKFLSENLPDLVQRAEMCYPAVKKEMLEYKDLFSICASMSNINDKEVLSAYLKQSLNNPDLIKNIPDAADRLQNFLVCVFELKEMYDFIYASLRSIATLSISWPENIFSSALEYIFYKQSQGSISTFGVCEKELDQYLTIILAYQNESSQSIQKKILKDWFYSEGIIIFQVKQQAILNHHLGHFDHQIDKDFIIQQKEQALDAVFATFKEFLETEFSDCVELALANYPFFKQHAIKNHDLFYALEADILETLTKGKIDDFGLETMYLSAEKRVIDCLTDKASRLTNSPLKQDIESYLCLMAGCQEKSEAKIVLELPKLSTSFSMLFSLERRNTVTVSCGLSR